MVRQTVPCITHTQAHLHINIIYMRIYLCSIICLHQPWHGCLYMSLPGLFYVLQWGPFYIGLCCFSILDTIEGSALKGLWCLRFVLAVQRVCRVKGIFCKLLFNQWHIKSLLYHVNYKSCDLIRILHAVYTKVRHTIRENKIYFHNSMYEHATQLGNTQQATNPGCKDIW